MTDTQIKKEEQPVINTGVPFLILAPDECFP